MKSLIREYPLSTSVALGGGVALAVAWFARRAEAKTGSASSAPSLRSSSELPSNEEGDQFLTVADYVANTFPENLAAREQYILDAVRAGKYEAQWSPVVSSANGHTATFWVLSDGLKVNGVRVNASAYLEQQIADLLGARLLTPKLADLAFQQAKVRLPPLPMPITSSTLGMVQHSQKVDRAIGQRSAGADVASGALVGTFGKHWVLDNQLVSKPGRAVNYGWHHVGTLVGVPNEPTVSGVTDPATGQPITVIQGPYTAHDARHVDYSQTVQLVRKKVLVDGQEAKLDDVLQSAELAPLVSHQGPLKVLRQPGVPDASQGMVA